MTALTLGGTICPLIPYGVLRHKLTYKKSSSFIDHPELPDEMRQAWLALDNKRVPFVTNNAIKFDRASPLLRNTADFVLPIQLTGDGVPMIYPEGHHCAGGRIREDLIGGAARGFVFFHPQLTSDLIAITNNGGAIIIPNITEEDATMIYGALEMIAATTGESIGKLTTEAYTQLLTRLVEELGFVDMKREYTYDSSRYSKKLRLAKPARPHHRLTYPWHINGTVQRVGFMLFSEDSQTYSHALLHEGPLVYKAYSASPTLFFLDGVIIVKTDKRQANRKVITTHSLGDFSNKWQVLDAE